MSYAKSFSVTVKQKKKNNLETVSPQKNAVICITHKISQKWQMLRSVKVEFQIQSFFNVR